MTQNARIIQYLEEVGSITPMEAFSELGITKLSTRIGEIERTGVSISRQFVEGKSRYGDKMRYMRYRLEAEQ